MTKEEAIKRLMDESCKSRLYCELYPDACMKEECEIYMAVEALKKGMKGEAFGGTLIIAVDDYSKVNRVIVKGEGHFGCVFEPIYDDEEFEEPNYYDPALWE